MSVKNLHFLSMLVGILFIQTFILTYCLSVYNNHVVAVWPYISDTGSWGPESCIFGIVLNIGSVLSTLTQNMQILYVIDNNTVKPWVHKANKIALLSGLLAAFGLCLVANFQIIFVFTVHMIGAILAFGMGSFYQCLQTGISFAVYPAIGNKLINITRLISSVICSVSFFICLIFGGLALLEFQGKDTTRWHKEDGGYKYHFISSVAEWINAISTVIFLVLYTKEFKNFHVKEPELVLAGV